MPKAKPRHTRLYDALEVAPDASAEQIKKAYRKMAMKWCALKPCRASCAAVSPR
jgi:preprotein translocase subunit Sec63